MKNFRRAILAFAVAVLGFASLVLDAGLGSLRVNKLSTGFSRTPSQIVSTHTPKAADSDNIGNTDDSHSADSDNVGDGHSADSDNADNDSKNNAGKEGGDADGNTDVTDDVDGAGDNSDNTDNTDGNAGANDDDNTGNGTNDEDNAKDGANDNNAGDCAGNDADDNAGNGAGNDADDSKPIDGDTPPTELDLVKLKLTQVMDDFVKVFSQFDFSMYTSRSGRVFELYCFGYLYTNGHFDTKWLKSSNIYDYQEAITSMKSLTTLVVKVLESAREEVPEPNLVSFEKYFESVDDYINQLNAEYQPLTYVTCQNTRPSK